MNVHQAGRMIGVCAGVLAMSALSVSVRAGSATFTPLGDLAGGDFFSYSFGVSGNGAVVVGQSTSASVGQAVSWSGGALTINALGSLPALPWSFAASANFDGSVIVGTAGIGSLVNGHVGFRRVGGVNVPVGDLFGGEMLSEAWGVSNDGGVVVGRSFSTNGYEAFRWTQAGGMVGLGDLAGGEFGSDARACSSDGSVVVGRAVSDNGIEAFRWTQASGMVGLGDLLGGLFVSYAYDCSADGSVVVGYSQSASGDEAFRWTQGSGMVGLGDLAGGGFSSVASACSADGRVVVGASLSAMCFEAFVWTPTSGMRSLQDILTTDFGVNLDGWMLYNATGISDDGLTIVGYGSNPAHQYEAFVVRFSSALPAVAPILADANSDGHIDFADLSVLLAQFGQVVSAGSGADFNDDGRVNNADLSLLLSQFGTT